MPVSTLLINVSDVQRAVAFYQKHLRAELISPSDEYAELDLVTATIRLAKLTDPSPSTWIADDLQRGFRHIGFKVDSVDRVVAELDAAGVEFHLRPIEAVGDVRITFFFDPDGTLLELVERDLQYHDVVSEQGVARERALGVPTRPRFDHVAVTAADAAAIRDRYALAGFEFIGSIHHTEDPRGFEIDFLKGADTVLEVFTFAVPTSPRAPQLTARGFAAVAFQGADISVAKSVGVASDGHPAYADDDGLVFEVAP